jgi:hypothetical protein
MLYSKEELDKIREAKKKWEECPLKKRWDVLI